MLRTLLFLPQADEDGQSTTIVWENQALQRPNTQ